MTYPHNPLPEWLQFEDEELGVQPIPATGYPEFAMTLYLYSAPNFGSGNIPLYIAGTGASLNTTLYIKGGGTPVTNSIPLYTSGMGYPVASGMPLYLEGRPKINRGLNLVVGATKGLPIHKTLPLFLNGSNGSGLYKMKTLYIDGTNIFPGHLNLFLKNTDSHIAFNHTLNLYTKAENPKAVHAITMFLDNTGHGSGLSLFIQGGGSGIFDPTVDSDGFYPAGKNLNLFVKRPNFPATMPLFIKVSDGATTSGIPLYTQSANFSNNNTPLVMPKTKAVYTHSANLTVSGF